MTESIIGRRVVARFVDPDEGRSPACLPPHSYPGVLSSRFEGIQGEIAYYVLLDEPLPYNHYGTPITAKVVTVVPEKRSGPPAEDQAARELLTTGRTSGTTDLVLDLNLPTKWTLKMIQEDLRLPYSQQSFVALGYIELRLADAPSRRP